MSATTDKKPFATAMALRLLELHPNWYFFKIDRGTKAGGMPKGNISTAATNDPKVIDKWPINCNVGLALKKSGLIVADVDVKSGKVGADTLDNLELEYGLMPETYTVRTGSGGTHYYYTETDTTKHVQGNNKFGQDIDCPGYVLIAGCQVEGKFYTTITKAPKLAPAPEWFAEYLKERPVPTTGENEAPAVDLDEPENINRAIFYLKNDAPKSIIGKSGERTTLLVAATLKDLGIGKDKAIELMAEHYNVDGKCDPLWNFFDGPIEDRMDKKIDNAWNYLRQTQPGALGITAEDDFGADPLPPLSDTEMTERLNRTAERRKRREQQAEPETWESLKAGWCYIGQQKRYVRKRDGMLWETGAFSDYFASVEVPDKSTSTTIHRWITTRKQGEFQKFDTFCYMPGEDENVGGAYNQYVASAIVPIEGDTTIWDEHLKYLFPVESIRSAVLDWLAWVLQNLDKKPKHALFIRGQIQGTGKSFIGDVFAALIGEHNRTPVDQGDFETPHNGWQMRTKLVTCEEVRSLSLPATRKLHGWLTQGQLHINEKNMPQVTIPDVLAYLFFSNKADALPIDDSDRRYLIVGTDAKPKGRAYYCRLYDLLDDLAALAAIKYQLMTRKLGDYTAAGAAPYTDAKGEMIEASASDLQSYMVEHAGEVPFSYRLVTVDEIIERLPRHVLPRQRVRATLYDVLRRRFNGIHVEGQIRPRGRQGDKIRVWAIGPTPEVVEETLRAGSLATIYRDERAGRKTDSASDDFADE